jgi:hypothetical protein
MIFSWKKEESEFWKELPNLGNNYRETSVMTDGEDLYKYQCEHLANAILLKDYDPKLTVNEWAVRSRTKLQWLCKQELIAGSFLASEIAKSVRGTGFETEDIDIYFKSKEHAQEFCTLNNFSQADFKSLPEDRICIRFNDGKLKFNLIWGVEYDSPEHLVSRFDIRACAMALSPYLNKMWAVNGALHDAYEKSIVFNPVPRATSVQRLVKYTEKGFKIEKYQRLFFAELIRSEIYSKDVELTTGYEVKSTG